MFNLNLNNPRSNSWTNNGGRSALHHKNIFVRRDSTPDMGAVIYGSQSVCGSKGIRFRSGQHDRKNMYCRENGNATRGAVELRAEMPNEINTIQNAWNVICEFEYLVEADHSARKGKRYRAEVLAFTANLEHNLFQIQEQMIAVDCPLGPYRKLWVSVPKKRLVMALPYPDRIVQ